MMARATRSTTADLKRKRSVEHNEDDEGSEHAPAKLARLEDDSDIIEGQQILEILELEDKQGLLDRVFPLSQSLRSLLTVNSKISLILAAISNLEPISRANLSRTAQQQRAFCSLARSLVQQAHRPTVDLQSFSLTPSSPKQQHRPEPGYALVQHLPSGDYWSSLASLPSPSKVQTANAELVAILPSPSSPFQKQLTTLGSYSRPTPQKKPPLAHRIVSTGAFLDYGLFSSFAPSFEQDGELVGRNELGQVLYYREEKKRIREAIARERLEGKGSIVDVTQDESSAEEDQEPLELESLLPPQDVEVIKATLATLQFEKSIQKLLEQNQRALVRLEELQIQRLTKHPTTMVEEGSEEWDTAQAIMDSLAVLTSLRPRTSSGESIIPPLSVLRKLHRTLAVEPSPGWQGTLPASRTTALRDDSTVKVRPGVPVGTPTTTQPATSTAATPVSAANQFGGYAYAYAPATQQQQSYRTQQSSYAYKPGQQAPYFQGFVSQPTQQQQGYYSPTAYATGTANQQPYGSTGQQQAYANYSAWYSQYQAGSNSGRGTPQPGVSTPTTYGNFFNSAGSVTPARPAAVANTAVPNSTAGYPTTVKTNGYVQSAR